jgi:hypothetical protein
MERYAKFVLQNNQTMPDPTEDIIRISELHSWYKHLGNFNKAYPILLQGEEARYSFSPDFTDNNQKNFHWGIVMDYSMNHYNIKISEDEKYQCIPKDIQEYMIKFPIYLDHDFCNSDTVKPKFLRHMCKKMCEEFWDGLGKYQNIKKIDI